VGDNLPLLSSEIEKIKIYKNNDKTITKDDINNLTCKSLEENNFKLIDAIISKNKNLAFELYNDRIKLNEEPIAIIIALANQIRIMYQVKQLYLNGYTENDIAKNLNNKKCFIVDTLEEAVKVSKQVTKKGDICLLSPAAASYGYFKNFEEKGNLYKKMVQENY